MIRIFFAVLFGLALFASPVWAVDVGYDCAEGSDNDIVAETQPVSPAGV